MKTLVLLAVALPALAGCGSQTCADSLAYSVSPTTATIDHTGSTNQQQFLATSQQVATGSGCASSDLATRLTPTWTTSDSLHIQISSAAATNGLATCLGPTNGPATITATLSSTTGTRQLTASLTCK